VAFERRRHGRREFAAAAMVREIGLGGHAALVSVLR
jgi:hypothetical protein